VKSGGGEYRQLKIGGREGTAPANSSRFPWPYDFGAGAPKSGFANMKTRKQILSADVWPGLPGLKLI
jgi:hypothetical protein